MNADVEKVLLTYLEGKKSEDYNDVVSDLMTVVRNYYDEQEKKKKAAAAARASYLKDCRENAAEAVLAYVEVLLEKDFTEEEWDKFFDTILESLQKEVEPMLKKVQKIEKNLTEEDADILLNYVKKLI